MTTTTTITGGCQCGAVRYLCDGELANPHICHCRMCQKAADNYFMPLANVDKSKFHLTRGEIAWFNSSDPVRRGFCSKCGTPLAFETLGFPHLNIVLGSLDRPAEIQPTQQFGLEAKMSWFDKLDRLPGVITEQDPDQMDGRIEAIYDSNHQHPDHDTETWPLKKD